MAAAIYDSVTVDVISAGYIFRATHSVITFAGFTAVYEETAASSSIVNNTAQLQLGLSKTLVEGTKELELRTEELKEAMRKFTV
jgi:DNA topoisomerase IA